MSYVMTIVTSVMHGTVKDPNLATRIIQNMYVYNLAIPAVTTSCLLYKITHLDNPKNVIHSLQNNKLILLPCTLFIVEYSIKHKHTLSESHICGSSIEDLGINRIYVYCY